MNGSASSLTGPTEARGTAYMVPLPPGPRRLGLAGPMDAVRSRTAPTDPYNARTTRTITTMTATVATKYMRTRNASASDRSGFSTARPSEDVDREVDDDPHG